MADNPDNPVKIYQRKLAELLASIDQGNADLASIHAELSAEIIASLRKLDTWKPVNVQRLQEQFDAAFAKSLPKRARIVRQRIEEGAVAGRRAAQQTIRAVHGDKVTEAHVRATAGSLREAGERIAGRVAVDGKSLAKRMVGVDREVAQEMAGAVQSAIREQRGIIGAAREIEKLDPRSVELPGYLRKLEEAARGGRTDAVKKLAKQYKARISRLGEAQTDGTFKASAYSLKAAAKRFVSDVQRAGVEDIDKIVKRYVQDKLAFRSARIARHETTESFRRSYIEQSRNKRGVHGFRWQLSPTRHVIPDECNVYASVNRFGLGPGVYPADHVPHTPHPLCICSTVAVFDRKTFDRENPEEVPDDMRDTKSPGVLDWYKQNDAAARAILGKTRHELFRQGIRVFDDGGKPLRVRDVLASIGRTAAE
jgi:hypothetical protein